MKSTAIIRFDFASDKYRVYDSMFIDNGKRFDTKSEALKYAKSRGYAYVSMSAGAFDECIDRAILRYRKMK